MLEQAGHRVVAPDLPSLGIDRTPSSQVSMEGWARYIASIVESQPEPVVLVGHSRGGIVISQAAQMVPQKVRTLVYLCAFLLRDGETLFQVAHGDPSSLVLPNLKVDEAQGRMSVAQEALRQAFYADCPAEDVALATMLLVPESVAPSTTPLSLTSAGFGRVPRVYIECLHDRAIPIALQRQMQAALPCQQVITMDTSHSPFFSAPGDLVGHLTSL